MIFQLISSSGKAIGKINFNQGFFGLEFFVLVGNMIKMQSIKNVIYT